MAAPSLTYGYEVRGALGKGGQQGLRTTEKWVQQRGQSPPSKEIRAPRPNSQARDEARAAELRGFLSPPFPVSKTSSAVKIPMALEPPSKDLVGEAMQP